MSTLSDPPPMPDSDTTALNDASKAPQRRTGRWLLIVASLAGAALGWWALEYRLTPFPEPEEMATLAAKRRATVPLSDEENDRLAQLGEQLDRKNAAAAWAVFGVPIVALAGVAAGVATRSWGASIVGVFVGAIFGATVGGAAGWVSALVYQTLKLRLVLDASFATIGAHALGWSLIAIALATTHWLVGRKSGFSWLRLTGTAVAGAILAALLYPVVTAFAFPMSNSDLVIPSGNWNRLAWLELNTLLIASGVLLGTAPQEPGARSVLGRLRGNSMRVPVANEGSTRL